MKTNALHRNKDEGQTGIDQRPCAPRFAAPIPESRADVKKEVRVLPVAKAIR